MLFIEQRGFLSCAGNCMSEFMGLITGTYEAKVAYACVLNCF